MSRLVTTIMIRSSTDHVWDHLSDLASHAEWMSDAESIVFTSKLNRGLGTTFDCVTKVGPIRTTDHMEITEWEEGRAIGVHHRGTVTGTGRFELRPINDDHVELVWDEQLEFPAWTVPRVTSPITSAVLRFIWNRNLTAFKNRVEADQTPLDNTATVKEQ
jgi:hypothetical protein